MSAQSIEAQYETMFGFVPDVVHRRIAVAEAAGLADHLVPLEAFRRTFLDGGALPTPTQRLVHFGMTLAQSDREVSEIHARSALKEGVTATELFGVCETAAVVFGMPGFTRGIAALASVLDLPRTDTPDAVR